MINLAIRAVCSLIFAYAGLVVSIRLAQAYDLALPGYVEALDRYGTVTSKRSSLLIEVATGQRVDLSDTDVKLLARFAPLDTTPYALRMIEHSTSQNLVSTSKHAAHIIRLNPRSTAAHLVETRLAIADQRYEAAFVTLARLIELDRPKRNDYVEAMVEITSLMEDRSAVREVLATRPNWGGQFIGLLATKIDDIQFLRELFDDYPQSQSGFVRGIANRGDLERAYIAFLAFLDSKDIATLTVPYDMTFQGLSGAQPFNWTINNRYAGIEKQSGLYISFFGKGRPMIAEQILVLSPGTYSVAFDMSGQIHRNGGSFEWTVHCAQSNDEIMQFPIEEVFSATKLFEETFSVPKRGCVFQRLRLSGVAGEFPRTTRAEVKSVLITLAEAPER